MQFEFWVHMGMMLLMQALHDGVKSPESKAKFKAAFLRVHKSLKVTDQTICAAYSDDPDFV